MVTVMQEVTNLYFFLTEGVDKIHHEDEIKSYQHITALVYVSISMCTM